MLTLILGVLIGGAGGYFGHDKIAALIASASGGGTPPTAS